MVYIGRKLSARQFQWYPPLFTISNSRTKHFDRSFDFLRYVTLILIARFVVHLRDKIFEFHRWPTTHNARKIQKLSNSTKVHKLHMATIFGQAYLSENPTNEYIEGFYYNLDIL